MSCPRAQANPSTRTVIKRGEDSYASNLHVFSALIVNEWNYLRGGRPTLSLRDGDGPGFAQPAIFDAQAVEVGTGRDLARHDLFGALLVGDGEGHLDRIGGIVCLGRVEELCVLAELGFR